MNCKSCNKQTDKLELHHIVPRSKGGGDNDGNLIELCIDCHSKVHNVDFNGKDGLISKSLKKRKEKLKKNNLFIKQNKDYINKKIEDISKNDYESGLLLSILLEKKIIDSIAFIDFLSSGKLYLKSKLIIDYDF